MGNKHDIIKIDRSYSGFLADVVELLEQARRASARSVNAVMTVAYWEVGRRVVEHEQQGKTWAGYGEALVEKLAADLTQKFGKGFSQTNAKQMREFYLAWPIRQTLSDESKSSTAAEELEMRQTASDKSRIPRFPLPSSHYVRLLTVKHVEVRIFYDTEALRGGWSVRQLDRQISSRFYERTALSRNKTELLKKGQHSLPTDQVSPEEEVKDPMVLGFLGLKDEYSESTLEEALILHLEHFLLELGNEFAFIARQRRLRVGDELYRMLFAAKQSQSLRNWKCPSLVKL